MTKMTKAPQLVTFGCRLNTYESEVMSAHAVGAGIENAIIVNTCAVTSEATRKSRQEVRKLARNNPDAKIIVTGCAAQIAPDDYAAIEGVSHVIGNDEKLRSETWSNLGAKIIVNDIMSVKETAGHLIQGFESRARAFLQVQNGCDHRCTFCIIPYGRGNSRSVPITTIVEQVRLFAQNNVQEVVLTGVDITSYGADLPGAPTLGQMIKRVMNAVPEMKRFRLSSLDCVEIDDDLWRLIAEEERLLPHLHLSVQAGDDMVLKRMKRRHLRHHIIDIVEKARDLRPDMVFGADIIAGFPTETDEMFQNTLNLVEDAGLTFLHVFPYSSREATPAAKMPQVDMNIRKERALLLREAGKKQEKKLYYKQLNKNMNVLIERDNKGHSDQFMPVKLLGQPRADLDGQVIKVRITGLDEHGLLATTA